MPNFNENVDIRGHDLVFYDGNASSRAGRDAGPVERLDESTVGADPAVHPAEVGFERTRRLSTV
jgi:hypothetical protein